MIDASTKLCGLIGHPVGHSLSPAIHNNLAEYMNINMAYLAYNVEDNQLEYAVKGGQALGLIGFNVTVPYKVQVMNYLKEVDDVAKKIGAVNTLVKVDGGYKGYNTDYFGFIESLKSDGVEVKDQNVILLGSGGVSNAIVAALVHLEAKNVLIINRNIEKARNLKERFETAKTMISIISLKDDIISFMDIVRDKYDVEQGLFDSKWICIQATSVGMHPNDDDVVIDNPEFYSRIKIGYDVIFNPENTKFMQLVKDSGGKAYNGLKMLLYQGVKAFELWNEVEVSDADVDKLYKILVKLSLGK